MLDVRSSNKDSRYLYFVEFIIDIVHPQYFQMFDIIYCFLSIINRLYDSFVPIFLFLSHPLLKLIFPGLFLFQFDAPSEHV